MEKDIRYVVESPIGVLLWSTLDIAQSGAIKKFSKIGYVLKNKQLVMRKWPYWNLKGYKTVAVGKL